MINPRTPLALMIIFGLGWLAVTAIISYSVSENFGQLWLAQIFLGFLMGLSFCIFLADRTKNRRIYAALIFFLLYAFLPSRIIFEFILGNEIYSNIMKSSDIGIYAFLKLTLFEASKILLYCTVSLTICSILKTLRVPSSGKNPR